MEPLSNQVATIPYLTYHTFYFAANPSSPSSYLTYHIFNTNPTNPRLEGTYHAKQELVGIDQHAQCLLVMHSGLCGTSK